MDVTTAVTSRFSCRAFLDQPVAIETVRQILDIARQAPSGGNLQPWFVDVLTGETLAKFRALIRSKLAERPIISEGTEYDIYPPDLHEPYRSRRYKCGEDLYASIDVPRDDRLGRLRQYARNFEFFGAPVALFFSIDRRMGADQWADVGMFMQNIMLLARERGLDTCAQESWADVHKTVGEFIRLPAERMLFCGMALGHRDDTAPINSWRTDRAALDEFVEVRD